MIMEKLESISSSDSSSQEDLTPVKPRKVLGVNRAKNAIVELRSETPTADGGSESQTPTPNPIEVKQGEDTDFTN